ncbi:nucleoside 2-deoxyribosyltransferase domain-containing protein [Actinomadura sp. HBU206391]|uniref:nucleoside 2-deoxyribosyltransferase domain-containing protein n=1 Tax=Actinomadura sp. HBU206391 TaxID=2731692 RepID=UPI0016509AE6|nr:nucleoside 2-deoxyribosyltransferase domain-containing protein [Actinomadura sp. HBU206391]MBC6460937.1 NUDIX hydrolase [Actinomadura sp. HBU206391]
MSRDVVVVHAGEPPPADWHAAVFLAGPSPRRPETESWRPEMIERIREQWREDGRLVVFDPERRDGHYADYTGQVEWEERSLHLADEVIFWVPRELAAMPAFTTNVEWGMWHDSGRVVFGAPPEAPGNRYLLHYADTCGVPTATTPADTAAAALRKIGAGAYRRDGERGVPLLVWRTESFRRWYQAQRGAGNALRAARVVWTFGGQDHGRDPGQGQEEGQGQDEGQRQGRALAYWALHVHVHVAAEDRVKCNEVVISRPDTSVVALYRRGAEPDDTTVVLVREFRSAAATSDGFVHELPGGSGPGDPLGQAISELDEETGLVLEPGRLRAHGARQVAPTVSAHRVHLFSAEITAAELDRLRVAGPHGVAADGERTHVEIRTYGEVRSGGLVDWATLGMLAEALGEVRPPPGSPPRRADAGGRS